MRVKNLMKTSIVTVSPDTSMKHVAGIMLEKGISGLPVVSGSMPARLYRFWYLGHGVAGMRRNILNLVGIGPVHETLFGMAEKAGDAKRRKWISAMDVLGKRAG